MAASPNPAARATGAAAGRGLLLIVVAVAIGLLLLRATVDEPDAVEASPGDQTETTTTPPDGTDTTGDPGTTLPDGGDEGAASTVPGDGSETPATTALPTDVRDPSAVLVQVVNAKTGVNGAAGRITDSLDALGYLTAEPTNTIDAELADSIIHYEPGYLAEANKLAGELNFAIENVVQPMPPDPASVVQTFENPNILILLGVNQAPAG
jgi:LytR cell envelope-related transcriptional attenuator